MQKAFKRKKKRSQPSRWRVFYMDNLYKNEVIEKNRMLMYDTLSQQKYFPRNLKFKRI